MNLGTLGHNIFNYFDEMGHTRNGGYLDHAMQFVLVAAIIGLIVLMFLAM